MSKKANGTHWAKTPAHKNRRMGVIIRLENQLKSGKKPIKHQGGTTELTERDVVRIKREIETLKFRI